MSISSASVQRLRAFTICQLIFLSYAVISLPACNAPRDAATARSYFDAQLAGQLVPLLEQAIRFPTYQGNTGARDAQQAWLMKTAAGLGLVARDTGKVVEIELAGPAAAPVLGLVVHGDVQPVEERAWSIPPFAGVTKDGYVLGRGSCDDKGPLVQAMLAMKALEQAGPTRTHTVRLLVGSDEESDNTDIAEYLAHHAAPDYSLVLDYVFPVVVGEKAWTGLFLDTKPGPRGSSKLPYRIESLQAGLAPSIVPDRAQLVLRWLNGSPDWHDLQTKLASAALPEGTRLEVAVRSENAALLEIVTHGKSAHGGVNLEGGRNALVALARATERLLPPSGEDDLLAFARLAGEDLYGTGLGLVEDDPVWGRYLVNVATIAPRDDGSLRMMIVLRRPPPRTGPQIRAYLEERVRAFEQATGARFTIDGYWDDTPLALNPEAPLVKRLLASYQRATGVAARPAVAGGGTYAKRIPNAIAFGMWFPGQPYPGHDVDEKIPVADLQRGTHVLIEALADLACGARIDDALLLGRADRPAAVN
ncbi:MAG: Sapep family Mn(2+)-dependent dipeptidase [Acidobacteriota bacterium]